MLIIIKYLDNLCMHIIITDIDPETTTQADTTYRCYHYTLDEDERINSEKDNQDVCEAHGPDFVWTKGDVSKTPGCSWGCWCCQKI